MPRVHLKRFILGSISLLTLLAITFWRRRSNEPPPLLIQHPTAKTILKKPAVGTILFMDGWEDAAEFYNGEFSQYLSYYSQKHCGYTCVSTITTSGNPFAEADIVVFLPSDLGSEPPVKPSYQYWILKSFKDLSLHDVNHIMRHGYDSLIDYYMIRPTSSATPLSFIRDINFLKDSSFNENHDHHLPLNFVQIVSACDTVEDADAIPDDSLSSELSKLEPQAQLLTTQMCSEKQPSMHLPPNVTFAILDEKACRKSLVDQFLYILRSSGDVIPIVPLLTPDDTIAEFVSLAPPHSFISMSKFNNAKSLLKHLRDVTTDSKLFHRYHQWKASYTLKSETALDPIKSAVCRFCQLGFERPKNNEHAATQPCQQKDMEDTYTY